MVPPLLSTTNITDADTTKTPKLPLLVPLESVMMLNVPHALTTAGSRNEIYFFYAHQS